MELSSKGRWVIGNKARWQAQAFIEPCCRGDHVTASGQATIDAENVIIAVAATYQVGNLAARRDFSRLPELVALGLAVHGKSAADFLDDPAASRRRVR